MKITNLANPATPTPAVQENRVIKMQTQSSVSEPLAQVAEVAAQPTTTESKEAVATPAPLDPQHLALARKEKALRKMQLDLQAEREAFKVDQGKYVSKDSFKADAMKALNDAGVTYEELVQQQLNSPANLDPTQARIDALEAKLAGYDTKQAERTTSEYQQALKVIEGDVNMLVDSDPAFETIKARKASGEVVSLIEKVFEREGIILNVEDAAKLVEDKLADITLKEVRQLSQLKKIQAGLTPPVTAPATAVPLAGKPAKTLTNAMGVTRQLSSRERAILAFNNQLK